MAVPPRTSAPPSPQLPSRTVGVAWRQKLLLDSTCSTLEGGFALRKPCIFQCKVSTHILLARPHATTYGSLKSSGMPCVRRQCLARRLADSEFIARGVRRTGHVTIHITRVICQMLIACKPDPKKNNALEQHLLESMSILLQTTCCLHQAQAQEQRV